MGLAARGWPYEPHSVYGTRSSQFPVLSSQFWETFSFNSLKFSVCIFCCRNIFSNLQRDAAALSLVTWPGLLCYILLQNFALQNKTWIQVLLASGSWLLAPGSWLLAWSCCRFAIAANGVYCIYSIFCWHLNRHQLDRTAFNCDTYPQHPPARHLQVESQRTLGAPAATRKYSVARRQRQRWLQSPCQQLAACKKVQSKFTTQSVQVGQRSCGSL